MIRAQSVTKFYGTRPAVRDLSFEIEQQEVVGLLGLNGAGKSTTLRMLAGLLAPSSGRIEIDGEPLHADRSSEVRRRIGFLPERPPLYDELTVEDFVVFAGRLRGLSKADSGPATESALEQTGLTQVRDQVVSTLSHGYRQRVGIAQAIVHRPSLVILDEPTGGLDPVQISQMRELIQSLRGQHTILVSSHNLPEIQQTCDRLLVMKEGRLVAQGPEATLRAQTRPAATLFELSGEATAVQAAFASDEAPQIEAVDGDRYAVRTVLSCPVEARVKTLVQAGLGVHRVEPQRSGLEELFVQLTSESQT